MYNHKMRVKHLSEISFLVTLRQLLQHHCTTTLHSTEGEKSKTSSLVLFTTLHLSILSAHSHISLPLHAISPAEPKCKLLGWFISSLACISSQRWPRCVCLAVIVRSLKVNQRCTIATEWGRIASVSGSGHRKSYQREREREREREGGERGGRERQW